MLSLRDVSVDQGGRRLIHGLDLSLNAGEALLVRGPNGSGKTTLLRSVCGLRRLAGGELAWQGTAVPKAKDAMRAELAYLGHQDGLHEQLTPRENLDQLMSTAGEAPDGELLDRALAQMGLGDVLGQRVRTLSRGQRRRAALARFLLTRRRLWVLDEPLTALDTEGRDLFQAVVMQHLRAGGLALLTCHTDSWRHIDSMQLLSLPGGPAQSH